MSLAYEGTVADEDARLGIGDDGACLTPSPHVPIRSPVRAEPIVDAPPCDVVGPTRTAVWAALDREVSSVGVQAAPGAGATTLLAHLAADASQRDYEAVVLVGAAAVPIDDLAQRIAAALDRSVSPRRYLLAERARIGCTIRALILIDRGNLDGAAVASLREEFSASHLVVAGRSEGAEADVVMGPLAAADTAALLQAAYGRALDAENRRVGLELCATAGNLPGPVRLLGGAAGMLRRSLISLLVEFGSADAIVRAAIAALAGGDRQLLEILALARGPLAAHHLAYVARDADVQPALARLRDLGAVTRCARDRYELARCAAFAVPRRTDDPRFERLVDALRDVFDPHGDLPPLDAQVTGGGAVLDDAFAHERWRAVLTLGPRLAALLARRGEFAAWGQVLAQVEAAADRAGDVAAAATARSDAATRATLMGDRAPVDRPAAELAAAVLAPPPGPAAPPLTVGPSRAAGPVRRLATAGAVAAVLALVALAADGVNPWWHASSSTLPAVAFSNPPALAGAGERREPLVPVAAVAHPATPRVRPVSIASFAAVPARVRVGSTVRLCYAASGAHALHIVPSVGSLTQLRACRTVTLREPHRYRYLLSATGDDGRVVMRRAQVDVVPAPRVPPAPRSSRVAARQPDVAPGLVRTAIYQFDATPSVVVRGQATSLCVGVERTARGYVTHVGPLIPGITRCYRVEPSKTTVYRLYITRRKAAAMQTITVSVRPAPLRRDVARSERR